MKLCLQASTENIADIKDRIRNCEFSMSERLEFYRSALELHLISIDQVRELEGLESEVRGVR
jgi:hypothetical protein